MSILNNRDPNTPMDAETREYLKKSRSFFEGWDDESFFEPMAAEMKSQGVGSLLTNIDKSASDSLVNTMENGIFRSRIQNARRDFVEPLHASMGFYAEEERKHRLLHHRENVSLLRSIDERLMKQPEEISNPIMSSIQKAYFNFTRMPVWTTIKATYDFVLKPLFSGFKSLLFGSKSEDKTVLKELQRQTELIRTGQIDQKRGFFEKIKEDGILGMGVKGLTQAFTMGGISRDRSQDAANRKARGESMTMFDKLSLRFHKDIVLPDREKAMSLIEESKKDDEETEEVLLLENIKKNTRGLLEHSKIEVGVIEGEFKRLTDELSAIKEIEADNKSVLDVAKDNFYKDSAIQAFRVMRDKLPLIQKSTELSAENAETAPTASGGGGRGGRGGIMGIVMGLIKAVPLIIAGIALLPMFKEIWDKLPMAEIFEGLKKVGSTIMTAMWDGLKIVWEGITTYAPKITAALGDWFRNDFPGVLSSVLTWLVTDGIPFAIKMLWNGFKLLGSMVTGIVEGVIGAIADLGGMAADWVTGKIANVWDGLVSKVVEGTDWVTGKITGAWDYVVEKVTGGYDFVVGIFSGFMDSIESAARRILPNRVVNWVFGEKDVRAESMDEFNLKPAKKDNPIYAPDDSKVVTSEELPSWVNHTINGTSPDIMERGMDALNSGIDSIRGFFSRGGDQVIDFDPEAFKREVQEQHTTIPQLDNFRQTVETHDDVTSKQMLNVLNKMLEGINRQQSNQFQQHIDAETLASSMGTL